MGCFVLLIFALFVFHFNSVHGIVCFCLDDQPILVTVVTVTAVIDRKCGIKVTRRSLVMHKEFPSLGCVPAQ